MNYYRSPDRKKTVSNRLTMLLTITVCLICWVVSFFYVSGLPFVRKSAVIPFWDSISVLLPYRLMSYLLNLLVFAFSAFVMQRISDIELLIRERTRLPFMIFMLLISTNGGLFSFNAISVVLLCLVGVIYALFMSYHVPEAVGRFYNAGFFIGVAGLLLPQVLWFIPLLWIGMYRFRSLDFKSFGASLIGILIVYWFVLGWCIWKHDFSIFAMIYTALIDFNFFSVTDLLHSYQLGFLSLIILLFIAFFHVHMDALNHSVRVRQMLSFLIYMSVCALILVLLYGNDIDSFLAILYLLSAVLVAYTIENSRLRMRFVLYYTALALWTVSFFIRIWSSS